MKRISAIEIISALLVLLFVYTASSKLLEYEQFKREMYNQTFPHGISLFVIWTLPGVEILTSFLIANEKTRLFGFYISGTLLIIFTIYTILILFNFFNRVPCSCGGVIKALGWKMHFVFNISFLILNAFGITIIFKERRVIGKET